MYFHTEIIAHCGVLPEELPHSEVCVQAADIAGEGGGSRRDGAGALATSCPELRSESAISRFFCRQRHDRKVARFSTTRRVFSQSARFGIAAVQADLESDRGALDWRVLQAPDVRAISRSRGLSIFGGKTAPRFPPPRRTSVSRNTLQGTK
jgi:hypothetical protein